MVAAVTASGASIAGCNSWPLGRMRYVAAASPGFIPAFRPGVSAAALAQAPVMVYDRKDRLPQQWLQAHGLATRTHAPQHFLPSTSAVRACEGGHGLGHTPHG